MRKTLGSIIAVLAVGAMLSGTRAVYVPLTAGAEETGTYELLTYSEAYDGIRITKCDRSAVTVDIPAEIGGVPVVGIDYAAFAYCAELESVTIPDSVRIIGQNVFERCTSLTSVEIPDGVTSIGTLAFNKCEKLADITIAESVKSIGEDAFKDTAWLTEQFENGAIAVINDMIVDADRKQCIGDMTIPQGITIIADAAFSGCWDITSVTIPEGVVTICESAFKFCSKMEEVTIPDTVEKIEYGAFSFCSALTAIDIPASVKALHHEAFLSSTNLMEINIAPGNPNYTTANGAVLTQNNTVMYACPAGITEYDVPTSVTKIGNQAFEYAEHLEKAVLREGVTLILGNAFNYCKELTEVWIPASMETINYCAFNKCEALTDVYYAGTEAQWNEMEISWGNECLLEATIHFESIPEPIEPTTPDDFLLGDVNADGEINALDAALILAEAALIGAGQPGEFTDKQNAAADVNGDNARNAADAAIILAYSAAKGAGQNDAQLTDFV